MSLRQNFLSDDRFDGFNFFCKVLHSSTNEAAITAVVSQLFPNPVVRPLAVNARQNIKLSRHFGTTCEYECDDMECESSAQLLEKKCIREAVEALTLILVQSIRLMPELRKSGLFGNTGLDVIKKDYCSFIKHLRQHNLASDNAFRKLEEASGKVETLCNEVELAGIPSVLCHGGLGLHNLTCPQGEERRRLVFDWGEAAISHPFFDIERAHGREEVDGSCFSSWSNYCDNDSALRAYRAISALSQFWNVCKRLWPSIAMKSFLLSSEYRADTSDCISYFLRAVNAWSLSDGHSQKKEGT